MTEAKLVDFEQQGVANMLRLPFQDHKESAEEKSKHWHRLHQKHVDLKRQTGPA